VCQARLDVAITQPLEVVVDQGDGRARRQALLWVVSVQLEVLVDQGFEQGQSLGWKMSLRLENLAQRLRLVRRPAVEGGDQLPPVDEVQLQRQDAQQQVAIGVHRSAFERISTLVPTQLRGQRPSRAL
jgi:hypothetical protein